MVTEAVENSYSLDEKEIVKLWMSNKNVYKNVCLYYAVYDNE